MWLADASLKNIFVPIDLENLIEEIKNKKFDAVPRPLTNSFLRPSIETMLHAIMPQKFVAHLHDIKILSYLVRTDFSQKIVSIMSGNDSWLFVDYFKPGADLANAVKKELIKKKSYSITNKHLFLFPYLITIKPFKIIIKNIYFKTFFIFMYKNK